MRSVLDPSVILDVARIFPHEEGQTMWWESYSRRTAEGRAELLADLQRRIQLDAEVGQNLSDPPPTITET